MLFSPQTVHCPNCGRQLSENIGYEMKLIALAYRCSRECYEALERKIVKSIRGVPYDTNDSQRTSD